MSSGSADESQPKLTRRQLFPVATVAAATVAGLRVEAATGEPKGQAEHPALSRPLADLEPWLFKQTQFEDVSRGEPVPHSLSEEKRRAVGLTRETWRLEVIPDPASPATLARPLTKSGGTALDFNGLMRLAEKHAVRFPKVMTCLNIGCPLGMGIWEGVPLREVLWLAAPKENLRRVLYYGYHNDDPQQMFRSTLPVGRVLEDPFDLPPVILCYKLNGQWLHPERGGPVRMVIPEAYGFKNVKWITHVQLSNLAGATDTYALENNDVDSTLKSFAATLSLPKMVRAGDAIPVTGYAQVGQGGLARVQVSVRPAGKKWPEEDPYFTQAAWKDARILSPPTNWGGDLPDGKIPIGTHGFDPKTGRPVAWPLRFAKAHWATVLEPLPPGEYLLSCRTIDEKGAAQPMPRPFQKSGHAAIESKGFVVKE